MVFQMECMLYKHAFFIQILFEKFQNILIYRYLKKRRIREQTKKESVSMLNIFAYIIWEKNFMHTKKNFFLILEIYVFTSNSLIIVTFSI